LDAPIHACASFNQVSPFDRCAEVFEKHGADFSAAVARNLNDGFLFSTPSFFIMGRPHPRGNTWFIEGMAGDCSLAWSILPYPLGWIAFYRFDNELHLHRMEDIRRLTVPVNEMAIPA
jgi:hypothetical protein